MKRFLIFSLILFSFLFGHIYQKVKIVTLAYQIHNKKILFDNLVEEKLTLMYNFSKDISLAKISKRLSEEKLQFGYPKRYVKIARLDMQKRNRLTRESIFAKILGFTPKVEAQP